MKFIKNNYIIIKVLQNMLQLIFFNDLNYLYFLADGTSSSPYGSEDNVITFDESENAVCSIGNIYFRNILFSFHCIVNYYLLWQTPTVLFFFSAV